MFELRSEKIHTRSWRISTRMGLPWWSSGQDSVLPRQRAWVWYLVRELIILLCHRAQPKNLGFPGTQLVKKAPAAQEILVQFLGWEDSLEEGMATHSSVLPRKSPWTKEPGGLQSTGSQRIRTTERLSTQHTAHILHTIYTQHCKSPILQCKIFLNKK